MGGTMEESQRAKIALNEAVFRSVNERVEELQRKWRPGVTDDEMVVVCECGDLSCAQQITVDVRAYQQVRSDPTLFIVAPGHEIEDVEEIVSSRDGYDVVCKNREPGRSIAQATDPRG